MRDETIVRESPCLCENLRPKFIGIYSNLSKQRILLKLIRSTDKCLEITFGLMQVSRRPLNMDNIDYKQIIKGRIPQIRACRTYERAKTLSVVDIGQIVVACGSVGMIFARHA